MAERIDSGPIALNVPTVHNAAQFNVVCVRCFQTVTVATTQVQVATYQSLKQTKVYLHAEGRHECPVVDD